MNELQPNDIAPDVTLMALDERPVRLSEFWRDGRAALLVFLRHLG